MTILTTQALDRPEEERLGNLALALAHAARHVEQQDHDRLRRRVLALGELAEAQVVIGEGGRFGAARGLDTAALDGFLDRAAAIEARARAASVPAFAGPVVLARLAAPGFEVGKLHFFPQPVDDVVDAEFQGVLDAAFLVAALAALLAVLLLWTADAIARFRLALADAFLFVRRTQPEAIVFEHPHGDADRGRAATENVGAGDDLRQMLAHGIAHLLVVTQPVACAAGEQVVPACVARALAARAC